ncbi:MAG TPA: hypothetical protein VH763_11415 [Gemmatimonadales bacterium]
MTLGRRYLLGVAVIGAAGGSLLPAVPEDVRAEAAWGLGTGLVLQTPLGWWALRSIGTERFLLVWVLGMLVRLSVVAIAGWVLLPVLGGRAGAMLGGMVAALVGLLLVEGFTAFQEHSREHER